MDVVNSYHTNTFDVVIRDSYVSTTALGQITTANIISDSSIKPDAENIMSKTITKLRIHMEQSIREKIVHWKQRMIKWYICANCFQFNI